MSRHRAIRSLNAADILAESESYDYDYDDYEYDENYEMTPEDKAQMDKGKVLVRNVIGQVEGISDKDIENALWNYYYNTEDAITYLLDEIHKSKTHKKIVSQKKLDSNKPIPAKKDLLSNVDHGKRYPSPVVFDANQRNPESHHLIENKAFTNCVSPNDIWLGHNVKWSSLTPNNLMFAENSIHKMQKNLHYGGLLGGADSEKPKSSQSKLSGLHSQLDSTSGMISTRTTNERRRSSDNQLYIGETSFSNPEKRSSELSLSSLAQLSVKQSIRPSLSSIATLESSKSQTNSSFQLNNQAPSLSSLAQKSISRSPGRVSLTRLASKKLDNRSSLQKTMTPIISNQSKTFSPDTNSFRDSISLSLSSQMLNKVSQPIMNDQTSEIAQSLVEKEFVQNTNQLLLNPHIAPPSIFATFIFEQLQDNLVPSNDLITFELNTTGSNNNEFAFNTPSPDDIALKARSQRGTDKVKQDASSTSSTASTSSPILKATQKSESKEKQPAIFLLEETNNVEILYDNMETLNLDSENTNTKKVVTKSPPKASPKHKRINVLEEYKKRNDDKAALNLVVVGHVDAGKSTLMGHFLYLLGEVDEKTMKRHEKGSSKIGKSSFAYAWVLDETHEERARGITIDVAITKFETEHRRFTLLDAPGHRDFIPNMISGAAQADVAILVIDSTIGEFEAGFESNGQTKEHSLLIRSLGVQQLVVAINKLDVVGWSQDRFNEIITKLNPFLNQAGFKKDKVIYIPCSGLTGENLLKRSQNILEWYSGPTLFQQIDKFEPPTRLLDKPFRLSVSDFFKGGIGSSGMGGITVAGKIEAGTIQVGDNVLVIPGGEKGVVKGLEINDESSKWAAAGDSILMTLTGLDILQLKVGSILCSVSHPVPVSSHILAQIVVFDVKVPITKGFPVILYRQSLNEPATITKLVTILDKSTGEIIKKNPRCLPKTSTATVEIKLTNRPVPFETYKENKELGRIMLRKGGETIAAGIITNIILYDS
ncbi:hypothetical protein RclHR1_20200002 [Rhizophagus clarus]|uniref:Elongation factor 1 alpha-like protein n=1 Tax=Rhizophagus clarus TaxID=94130 RepID=A0A2Z6RJK0_9GLOM|nr:hypothetical protein RclHR1_20200002 [Rhizophagus clarus]GES81978.1 HBS1-like protein isoform X1 [Rhizophagus clarus]